MNDAYRTNRQLFYFLFIFLIGFFVLFFTGCSNSNSVDEQNQTLYENNQTVSDNNQTADENNETFSLLKGLVQKGNFLGGEIKIQALSTQGELVGKVIYSTISSEGEYHLEFNGDGLHLLSAKGKFFNEYTGKNSTEEAELFALVILDSEKATQAINLNLFTSLASMRMLKLMKSGKSYKEALKITRQEMKREFGLKENFNLKTLNIHDVNRTNKDENLNLLLLSGGFLKSLEEETFTSKTYQKNVDSQSLDNSLQVFIGQFEDDGKMNGSRWKHIGEYDKDTLLQRLGTHVEELGVLVKEGESFYTPPWLDSLEDDIVVGGGGGIDIPIIVPPSDTSSFITRWKTDNNGASADNEIIISTKGAGYDFDVDWEGDGIWDLYHATGDVRHTYSHAGIYRVKIKGKFPRIFSNYQADRLKILSVEQWGNIEWKSMEEAFTQCKNLKINATDAPNLTDVTNMNNMLVKTAISNENLNSWDVSHVTSMVNLFAHTNYNGDITNWNISSLTDMTYMFYGAKLFNQDISNWNVKNVVSMMGTFMGAENFNQNINNWDVSSVTDMNQLFSGTTHFNQPLSNWNVEKVINMNSIFQNLPYFNQDISSWNVGNVKSMKFMFLNAKKFNQPLFNWNTSNVTDMSSMFKQAESFNQDISSWNVSSVTNMSGMFFVAKKFNKPLSNWDVSKVENMYQMFQGLKLSTENYDKLLKQWSLKTLKNNVQFSGGLSEYCTSETERNTILNTFNWTITDGGKDCSNHAPVITSTQQTYYMYENIRVVTTIRAEDEDMDTLTYSIKGGADQDKFTIDPISGLLAFNIVPDYENSTANGLHNQYKVKIEVSDGKGGTATIELQVIIKDVVDESNTPLMITSPLVMEIYENHTEVGEITANSSPLNFYIVDGLDKDKFDITFNRGDLTFKTAPDFENPTDENGDNIYRIRVRVYDNSLQEDIQIISIRVKDINENAPTVAPDLVDSNDTGVSNSDNITSVSRNVHFNVVCPAKDATIRLYFSGNAYNNLHTCQGSGVETIVVPFMVDATTTLTYTQKPVGATQESVHSPSIKLTIDTTNPLILGGIDLATISDTGKSNSDNITFNKRPTFQVFCENNNTRIKLWATYLRPNTFPGKITTDVSCQHTRPADRRTSVTFDEDFKNKEYQVTYIAEDRAGNTALAPNPIDITVDTYSKTPTVVSPTNGAVVTGTAEIGATVIATTPTSRCTDVVDDEGTYSCTLSPMPTDEERLEVVAEDIAGNLSYKKIGLISGTKPKPVNPCGCPDFADCMAN